MNEDIRIPAVRIVNIFSFLVFFILYRYLGMILMDCEEYLNNKNLRV